MNKSIFQRRLLLLIASGGLSLATTTLQAASPDDPSCKVALDAATKTEQTPHHEYVSITQNGASDIEGESIQVEGVSYIKVGDTWHVSPLTPKDAGEQRKENIRNAKVFTCQYERDDAVNGEAAAVYKTHQESDVITSDAELWVSKSRGLVLKEIVSHPDDKQSIAVRMDYTNVQKPTVTK